MQWVWDLPPPFFFSKISQGIIGHSVRAPLRFEKILWWPLCLTMENGFLVQFKSILEEGIDLHCVLLVKDVAGNLEGVAVEESTLILLSSPSTEGEVAGELVIYNRKKLSEYEHQATGIHKTVGESLQPPSPLATFELYDILFVLSGHSTPAFEPFAEEEDRYNMMQQITSTEKAQEASDQALSGALQPPSLPSNLCLSLVGADFSLDVGATDEAERDLLLRGFAALLSLQLPSSYSFVPGTIDEEKNAPIGSVLLNSGRIKSSSSSSSSSDNNNNLVLSRMDPDAEAAAALVEMVLSGLQANFDLA